MKGYSRWQDIRAEYVERAGGEEAVAEGKRKLLAEVPPDDRTADPRGHEKR
ncbi:hypothetical protein OWR29_17505 [Actinoplanes sp. Pm04-4]|uniref:Uncharacterized protein n=1 Tax=Paractinoplanes pyxinae TaxID=2997416 RepID=A0ABT4B2B7_9ACTN|nr:hypothetical protein [Actinoplanes pyxinae]